MKPADFNALVNGRRATFQKMVEGLDQNPALYNSPVVMAAAMWGPLLFACTEVLAQAIYACRPLERDP